MGRKGTTALFLCFLLQNGMYLCCLRGHSTKYGHIDCAGRDFGDTLRHR